MKLPLFDEKLKSAGELEVSEEILPKEPHKPSLYFAVNAYLANQRTGTASTLVHSEVRGTTKKMYRQKGTGNARHGDYRTNIFVGGGQVFGPKPREYRQYLPKRVKVLALKSALSARANENALIIIDDIKLKEPKTKLAVEALKKLKLENVLIVTEKKDETLYRAMKNIPHVEVTRAQDLNTYQVLKHEKVLFVRNAWDAWQKKISKEAKE